MTRNDALKIATLASASVASYSPSSQIIAVLEALGLLKFEEEHPQGAFATIASVGIPGLCGSVGPDGTERILKALGRGGFKIVRA